MKIFYAVFHILWGDFITIPLPGGSSLGISLLVLILIPSGIYFTIRTRFLPFRMFPDMIRVVTEKKSKGQKEAISGVQALIVSTATRVGMGNLVGVVAAISAGGAGSRVLDVADRSAGFFHSFCGGHSCPALQGKRPSLRRIPGRSGLLYPPFFQKE